MHSSSSSLLHPFLEELVTTPGYTSMKMSDIQAILARHVTLLPVSASPSSLEPPILPPPPPNSDGFPAKWRAYTTFQEWWKVNESPVMISALFLMHSKEWMRRASLAPPPPPRGGFKGHCIMVEPRNHPMLLATVLNMWLYAPSDWQIKLYLHDPKHLSDMLPPAVAHSPRLQIVYLPYADFDAISYSSFMMSASLYEDLTFEDLIVFQTDAAMLRPWDSQLMEEVMKSDFCGGAYSKDGHEFLINGGFSYRRKSGILQAIRSPITHNSPYEDLYFNYNVENLPKRTTCHLFCTNVSGGASTPRRAMALHGYDKPICRHNWVEVRDAIVAPPLL